MRITMLTDDNRDRIALYALNALEPAEMREIEQLLERDPEARSELRAQLETTAKLARGVPQFDPPADLETKLMARVRADREQVSAVSTLPNLESSAPRTPPRAAPPRPMARWAVIASGFALAASLALVALIARNASLPNLDPVAIERTVGARTLALQTTDGKSAGRVVLTPDGRVLMGHTLGDAPSGKTWQAWYIPKNAKSPVSLGVFQGSSVVVTIPTDAVAVAMSEEPDGGSAQPTLVRALAKI
jgi:anti-sigma-K factor RskA